MWSNKGSDVSDRMITNTIQPFTKKAGQKMRNTFKRNKIN